MAALAFVFLCAAPQANAGVSSIVIDADSGQVLEAHTPDEINYPASLTKMMTLYLTFQGLEAGKLRLDQRFTVSAHAADQAPSKLGLRPGSTIPLRDLVFGVITHSANDGAVVLAENIGGSEATFVARMNAEAKVLGMTNTHFDNPSGLPDPRNVTTARDLATLARALYRDFPKEYAWFATPDFTYLGTTYTNHNHLMESFAGMDGIKTGYIHASGFNLAASAVRGGRRLIAVYMGGESAHARDMKVAALLDEAFERPLGDVQVVDDEATEPHPSLARRAIAAISPVGRANASTQSEEAALKRMNAAEQWAIQVGAYLKRDAAERAAGEALRHLRASQGRAVLVTGPAPGDKHKVYRARLTHFTHREALQACRELHGKHRSCAVVAPSAAQLAQAR